MKFRRFLSVFIAILMLLTCFPLNAVSFAQEANYPTVYVCGQGLKIYSADGRMLYNGSNVPVPDGVIGDAVKKCLPLFINAVLFGDWDPWHQAIMEFWEPIYKDIRLDDNGENTNGSYGAWDIETVELVPSGDIGTYDIWVDWRLDPFETADILDQYIQKVKDETGADKVNLLSRCMGCNIVMAYLAAHGYDDLNTLGFYASAANGVDFMGAVFSGEFKFYPDELRNFYYSTDLGIGDENISALIDSAVDWLVETYGFEGACNMLEAIAPKMYEEVIYDILLTSYGTFPGIWSLVGPQYYAKAREVIFKGREAQYDGLIEKIDRYDTEVRQRNDELLLEAKAEGVRVAVFAKYGEFTYQAPLCKECNNISDDAINVPASSFGATVSDSKYVRLSDEYLASADAKYISPCKRIDASTCTLPDTTWFFYDVYHNDFSSAMDILLKKFIDMNGEMDVFTFEEFPQYLVKDGSTVRPMTEDDVKMDFDAANDNDENFFSRLKRIFTTYFQMIKKVFEVIIAKIKK